MAPNEDHRHPKAVDYAECFLRQWISRLEEDSGIQFVESKRIDNDVSSAFRSLYYRYAELNWSEKIPSNDRLEAFADPKYRDTFFPLWVNELQSSNRLSKATRKALIDLLKSKNTKKISGTIPYHGWHHLISIAIHNTATKFELSLSEDDFKDGKSAMSAVLLALARIFPDSPFDYSNQSTISGTIPGKEWLQRVWNKWRRPLRPHGRKSKVSASTSGQTSTFGTTLIESENDVFYAFFLSSLCIDTERYAAKTK